jgi:DGQHR domain-containing protein
MESNKIAIKCIVVEQPIGTFYVGVIDCEDLVFISYTDMRRLETSEREVETYLGIQRPLSPKREKEIGDYVNTVDATFPTSIILHIPSDKATYFESKSELIIERNMDVAKILDGQHRIAGLQYFNQPGKKFQINVTIFVDMDIEDQALTFAVINLKQDKVSKSLAYDLYDFAKHRSPQKTCHHIARLLNKNVDSPFYNKIKVLGRAEEREKETITQATFVEWLLKYISPKPMYDRDVLKRGKKLATVEGEELNKYFLRNLFIENKDEVIAKIVDNYFSAIRRRWTVAWDEIKPEMILNRSTGFIALMRFFRDAYLSINKIGSIVSQDEFYQLFKKIDIGSKDFNREEYRPGSGGQADLYKDLLSKSGLSK